CLKSSRVGDSNSSWINSSLEQASLIQRLAFEQQFYDAIDHVADRPRGGQHYQREDIHLFCSLSRRLQHELAREIVKPAPSRFSLVARSPPMPAPFSHIGAEAIIGLRNPPAFGFARTPRFHRLRSLA